MRGEIWWAQITERSPVVILSADEADRVRAMLIVPAAGTDISGLAAEMPIGRGEGLPEPGVLRVALRRSDRILCNWLVTVPRAALLERVGVLSSARLRELANLLRLGELE